MKKENDNLKSQNTILLRKVEAIDGLRAEIDELKKTVHSQKDQLSLGQ